MSFLCLFGWHCWHYVVPIAPSLGPAWYDDLQAMKRRCCRCARTHVRDWVPAHGPYDIHGTEKRGPWHRPPTREVLPDSRIHVDPVQALDAYWKRVNKEITNEYHR